MLWLLLAWLQATQVSTTPAQATASISGRVTDKETGQPIPRILIRLGNHDQGGQRSTWTDSEGRYEFGGLAPGRYSGFADGGQYRATHVTEPLFPKERQWTAVLKAGETRTGVDVALGRSLAISVRVLDGLGQPLSRIRVFAIEADTGREVFGFSPMHQDTDDRGHKRLFDLAPGRYIVCAETSSMAPLLPLQQPGRDRFLRTCAPSAASDDDAEVIQLERGDVPNVEIRMRRGRTYTISGIIFDANGVPAADARVSFNKFVPNGSQGTMVSLKGDGRFSATNLVPGDYSIDARIGGSDRPEQPRAEQAAFQPIVIENADVDNLIVRMARVVEAEGRFVIEDDAAAFPKPQGAGLMVSARLADDRLRGSGSMVSALVLPDRTFQFSGMFGRRRIDVGNVPRGWYVKSIRYGDKEVADSAVEFKGGPDAPQLEIVLSNRGATVSGRVVNERGEMVRGARIFLVPADPGHRSIFIESVSSGENGAFRAGPARAGDYIIAAFVPGGRMPDFQDPTRAAKLLEGGERVTLGNGEERTIDLTIIDVRRR